MEVEGPWLRDRDGREGTKIRKLKMKMKSGRFPCGAEISALRRQVGYGSHLLLTIPGKMQFPKQMCASLALPPPSRALSVVSVAAGEQPLRSTPAGADVSAKGRQGSVLKQEDAGGEIQQPARGSTGLLGSSPPHSPMPTHL